MPCRFLPRSPLTLGLVLVALLSMASASLAATGTGSGGGEAVSGQVTEEDGTPLAGARVELRPAVSAFAVAQAELDGSPVAPVARATADDRGRYRLAVPADGFWELALSAPGHVAQRLTVGPVEAEAVVDDVALAPAERLTVRVVDGAGEPLAGAVVVAVTAPRSERPVRWRDPRRGDAQPGGPRRTARTGDDGRAVVFRRAGETLRVAAAAAGLAPALEEAVAGDAVTLHLAAGEPVEVEVHDPSGKPVAGALVRLGPLEVPLGASGEDGRLTLHRDPRAAMQLLALGPAGHRGGLTVPAVQDDAAAAAAGTPAAAGNGAAPPEPRVISLAPSITVAGRTLGSEQRDPVAGAWVWRTGEEERAVRSDSRGNFTLATPGGPAAVLHADAPGYGPARAVLRDEQRDGGEPVTLLLAATAAAAGRVVDGAGAPVAGATVSAEPRDRSGFLAWGSAPTERTVSGADGGFRLRELAAGSPVSLTADHEGYAPATLDLAPLTAGTTRGDLEIVLDAGITAFGRVVDTDEEPVAGAEVELVPTPQGTDILAWMRAARDGAGNSATSDRDGRFEIADLAPGRVDVHAAAAGFAPLAVPGVELPAGQARVDLGTLLLAAGLTLEGRVVDPDGKPLADAEVSSSGGFGLGLGTFSRHADAAPETTGPDGRFVLRDLARGERVDVEVKHAGYTDGGAQGVELPQEEPLTVVLQPASTLSGVVLAAGGEPLQAQVMIVGEPQTGQPFSRTVSRATSDEDGRFVLEDVAPGRLTLSATARGYQSYEQSGVVVEPGEDRDDLRVVMQPGAVITGHVTDAGGAPLPGASVSLLDSGQRFGFGSSQSATTDADGLYRMDGVAPGEHSLAADHPQQVRAVRDLTVTLGDNRLDFRLERGLSVSGRVVDAGGAPVAGARVSLGTGDGVQSFFSGDGQVSDDAGAFTFDGVEPGSYRLTAQKEGYAPGFGGAPVVVAAAPVRDVEVRLERGAVVRGHLLGVELADLAEARVIAAKLTSQNRLPAISSVDFEGAFRIEGLAPGDWSLLAVLGDSVPAVKKEITIEPGQRELVVDLDLGGGGAVLSGRVLLGDEPLAGSFVSLTGREQAAVGFGRTDHQGRFEIRGLENGTYRLQVAGMGGFQQYSQEVEIAGDRDLEVRIPAAPIAGVVLGGGGPIEGAEVYLEPLDGERGFQRPVRTDSTGRFRLTAVPAGRYRLRATAADHAPGETEVAVEDGVPPADVVLRLQPAAGLVLRVAGAFGRPPDQVTVAALAPAAADSIDLTAGSRGPQAVYQQRVPVGEQGRVRLDSLPAGSWRLVVAAQGLGTVQVDAVSPGPERSLALPPAARLRVRVPDLADAGELGEVRVLSSDGHPFIDLDWTGAPRNAWPLGGGRTEVGGLPPGSWRLVASTPDGRSWTGSADTAAGATVDVELR